MHREQENHHIRPILRLRIPKLPWVGGFRLDIIHHRVTPEGVYGIVPVGERWDQLRLRHLYLTPADQMEGLDPAKLEVSRSSHRRSLWEKLLGQAPYYDFGYLNGSGKVIYGQVNAHNLEEATQRAQRQVWQMARTCERTLLDVTYNQYTIRR